MRRIALHPSTQLAWVIANTEACLSGSPLIKPAHFLVAILKIIDDGFQQEPEKLGLPPEAARAVASLAPEGRRLTGLPDAEITSVRRQLRKALREAGEPGKIQMLHRSEESRQLFQGAVSYALEEGSDELTSIHLLRKILEDLPSKALPFFRNRQAPGAQGSAAPSVKSGDATPRVEHGPGPSSSKTTTPLLDEIGRDLSTLARQGRLTPVMGREAEMIAIARHLQRTSKRNVILIGEAGVGKTAVVEGLAQRFVSERTPGFLRALRIVQVDVADLVAGTRYRGDMERRVQRIIAEVTANPNLVLFLDEIHLVVKAGSGGDSPMDVANLLRTALARGDFRCMGTTTMEEFERHIKGDAAFMRRFQIVRVGEPSEAEALRICRGWARRIEGIQGVAFEEDAIVACVTLSAQLIRGRSLPDKAIDLLENAATYVKVASLTLGHTALAKEIPRIGRGQIETVLEEQYGISVRPSGALDVERARSALQAQLVGQDPVIASLAEALDALRTKGGDTPRPLGIFLFSGPSGVGKTLAAECICCALFGTDGQTLGRFNMSEYKERHELARLTGAPPGFVGHERQGALFRFAEAHPQGLILLDEMEKAHPEIQDYFLQIFDKGEAMDSRGRKADFRRHLFVITCNVASDGAARHQIGFHSGDQRVPRDPSEAVKAELLQYFRHEFLARIDRIVTFRPLALDDYRALLARQFAALEDRMGREHPKMPLDIAEEAKERLCLLCADQEDGARGFIRRFDQILVVSLLKHIQHASKQSVIRVGWAGGRPVFS